MLEMVLSLTLTLEVAASTTPLLPRRKALVRFLLQRHVHI